MALTILFKGHGWRRKFSGDNRNIPRKEILQTATDDLKKHKQEIKKEEESKRKTYFDLGISAT